MGSSSLSSSSPPVGGVAGAISSSESELSELELELELELLDDLLSLSLSELSESEESELSESGTLLFFFFLAAATAASSSAFFLRLLRGLAGLRDLLRRLQFLALALAGLVHGLLLDLLAALLHHLLHDVGTIGVAAASRFRVGRGRPVGVSRVLLQSLLRKDVAVSTLVCDGTRNDRYRRGRRSVRRRERGADSSPLPPQLT